MAASGDLHLVRGLRRRRPLVHGICGAVSAPFIADVLGALGARAALTHDPAEAGALAARADAVLVNFSQLDGLRAAGAREAARAACVAGRPWVLDPVLVHVSAQRRKLARELMPFRPAVLKPNRAELAALAGEDGAQGAMALARQGRCVVLASGAVDIVGDGARSTQVTGGHVFMDTMSGFGCALGAAVAALLTVADAFAAAAAAARAFALAGEEAAANSAGPGSFRIAFIDALYRLGEGT